jgi:hypothetical protein
MSSELTPEQERALLGLARKSIENHFAAGGRLRLEGPDPAFKDKRGAFVTLKIGGELRGCVGYPLPYKALDEAVAEMAVAAASQDHRFEPLTPEELERTTIEISPSSPCPGRSGARTRWRSAGTGSSSARVRAGASSFPRSRSNTAGAGRSSSVTAASRQASRRTNGRRGPGSRSSRPGSSPRSAEAAGPQSSFCFLFAFSISTAASAFRSLSLDVVDGRSITFWYSGTARSNLPIAM